MALWHIPGQGIVNDAEEGASIPEPGEITLPSGEVIRWGIAGTQKLPEYRNALQYGDTTFQWDPTRRAFSGSMPETAPGYVSALLAFRDRQAQGQVQPWEVEQYQQWEQQARAIPTRDLLSLTAGWQGEYAGEHANQDWWTSLDPGSPDVGGVMLQLRDKLDAGTASDQERGLYSQVLGMANEWDWRASVPQASDAFNPMGDQFFQALSALTMAAGGAGSFGAFGAAAGAGAGAGAAASAPSLLGVPLSTLSSIGQIGAYGGMGANVLGTALDQDWLRQVGMALGVTGGLAGGLAGLGGVVNTGVQSVGDAARALGALGRVTGAVGTASGVAPLQQAAGYLRLGGQLGGLGAGVGGLLSAAEGAQQGAVGWAGSEAAGSEAAGSEAAGWGSGSGPSFLTPSLPHSLPQGDGMDFDYSWDYGGDARPIDSFLGWGDPYGPGSSGDPNQAYMDFLSWEDPTGPGSSGDPGFSGEGGGGGTWLSSVLGALGSVGGFLGKNAGVLGPAASALGSLGAGALGATASEGAAAAQAAALNRGLDLQTAQWLQSQANQAPWLQAGQGALSHLTGRSTWAGPERPGATPAVSGGGAALPSPTPVWQPEWYGGPAPVDAAAYRYTPGGVPSASQYRYTPGAIPAASQYRYTPGAVPTLSGQELLAQDPGVQFRLDRGRGALEASAAARGGALSGPALAALQEQGQTLASQEYGSAWQRASQQAQMREGWAQQASQMGYSQAMSEAQLREQVNQVASSQGWSQAQAETALREHLAQQASSQGFSQALAGQQAAYGQGLQSQQWQQQQNQLWTQQIYDRAMQQGQVQYGRDVYGNETNYQRSQADYAQQMAELTRQWNQFASLSGTGQVASAQLGQQGQQNQAQMASLLSQLGTAQGGGELGGALSWQRALTGAGNQLPSLLRSLNA